MPQYNASDTRVELQRDSSYGPSGHSSRAFEIMRMVRRHSRVVVGTAIAAVAASLLYVSSVTPLYTATATILIDPAASRALEPSKSPVTAADDSAVESQASLIQSESVLQRVVKGLQLASDPIFMPTRGLLDRIETFFSRPSSSDSSLQDMSMARAVETLRRRLAVSRRGSTYLIDVSASSPNRIQATSIANAIARAYEYDQISSRLDAAEAAAGLLRDRIEESKSRVTETEKAIQNYRSSRQSSEATSSGKGEPAPRQDSDSRVQNLDELLRQVETDRAVYERYLARYTDAGARKGMELPGSRIISAASPPIKPSFPDTTAVLGIGLMIGLLTGGLIAIAVDHLDRRIKTPEQAGVSGAPNIAALPEISTRELAHLARSGKGDLENYDPRRTRLLPHGLQPPVLRYAVARPMSAFAESVRAIRFALQHATQPGGTRIVGVTSAIGGEGKTTLAANLAQSLALLGVKTVLVDGDLRKPHLSRSLCPGAKLGLIEVALSDIPLNQVLLADSSTELAILPAPLPKDMGLLTEFASSGGLTNVLAELRDHFDVVIVDCPPLLPLVDGRALVERSDAVILTVGWDRTPLNVFHRAVELLGPTRDKVIGTVLTRVDFGRLKLYEDEAGTYGPPYVDDVPPLQDVDVRENTSAS